MYFTLPIDVTDFFVVSLLLPHSLSVNILTDLDMSTFVFLLTYFVFRDNHYHYDE